jgi:hypothetical protein
MNRVDFAAVTVLVVAGWAVGYAFLRRALRQTLAEPQPEMERRLGALAAAIESLQAKVAELSKAQDIQPIIATEFDLEASTSTADELPRLDDEDVTAEIMAVISAAATTFLGKRVRILSAKLLQSPDEGVNAWSQQGRVFVQASHNLRSGR